MKLKRLAALGVSLALTVSLSVTPAHAVRFTDVPTTFWGYTYIERMALEGLAKGYEDGTFKPNGKMTAAETLLFCARATGVDKATQARIAAARRKEIAAILPSGAAHGNMDVWATDEMALAVETDVISLAELKALAQVDPKSSSSRTYLEETMSRENITMYLARAMRLEPLAKSLTTYTLTYPDTNNISASLRPYVYVLTQYGIVNGRAKADGSAPDFEPQGSVTRAEMTTMLCRALDFMKESGIVTELSEYSDYSWVSGTISAVGSPASNGAIPLTLASPLTDTPITYSIPATAKIYHDNMLTTTAALKRGQFVRLNLDKQGVVSEARLSGALSSYNGSVARLEDDSFTLRSDGQSRNFTMDRFTSVAVDSEVGDRSLLDYDAGYTTAAAYVDEMGHLAAVRFYGGTHLVTGLVASVTPPAAGSGSTSTTLEVAAYNGSLSRYEVPEGVPVTVNGTSGALNNLAHTGKAVRLRISAEDGKVVSVAVDTLSKYIQGPITRVGRTGTAPTVMITDRFTGKDSPAYPVFSDAVVTYDGKPVAIPQIEAGWYATALVSSAIYSNDVIARLDAFPGSVQVEGVISEIKYADPTLLRVTLPDDRIAEYRLPLDNMPVITRNQKLAKITDLLTGDAVVLSVRYNKLEQIDATAQTADLTGILTQVSLTTSGATINVAFPNGSVKTYSIPAGVSVTQNGALTSVSALQPGATVAMVTNDANVVAIDITAPPSYNTRISGTVYTITNAAGVQVIELLVPGLNTPVKVDVKSTSFQAKDDANISLRRLATGDSLDVYGEYNGATFVAWLVVKL